MAIPFSSARTISGLDFCESMPANVVACGADAVDDAGDPLIAFSVDGGSTWTRKEGDWAGTTSNQPIKIAISASDIDKLIAIPRGNVALRYSIDGGNTWLNGTGGPTNLLSTINSRQNILASDRVNGAKAYVFAGTSFYRTADFGQTWTQVATGLPAMQVITQLEADYSREGYLWLSLGASGLYKSVDGGDNWVQLGNVIRAQAVGLGLALSGSAPAVYIYGEVTTDVSGLGLFCSEDNGLSWARIDSDFLIGAVPFLLKGDRRSAGVLHIATEGRGVVFGEEIESGDTGDPALPVPGLTFVSGRREIRQYQSLAMPFVIPTTEDAAPPGVNLLTMPDVLFPPALWHSRFLPPLELRALFVEPPPPPPPIDLDKWWQPISQPVLPRPPAPYITYAAMEREPPPPPEPPHIVCFEFEVELTNAFTFEEEKKC